MFCFFQVDDLQYEHKCTPMLTLVHVLILHMCDPPHPLIPKTSDPHIQRVWPLLK